MEERERVKNRLKKLIINLTTKRKKKRTNEKRVRVELKIANKSSSSDPFSILTG